MLPCTEIRRRAIASLSDCLTQFFIHSPLIYRFYPEVWRNGWSCEMRAGGKGSSSIICNSSFSYYCCQQFLQLLFLSLSLSLSVSFLFGHLPFPSSRSTLPMLETYPLQFSPILYPSFIAIVVAVLIVGGSRNSSSSSKSKSSCYRQDGMVGDRVPPLPSFLLSFSFPPYLFESVFWSFPTSSCNISIYWILQIWLIASRLALAVLWNDY